MKLCLLLFCLLLSLPLRVGFAAPAGLTVVAGAGTTQTDPAKGRYDFGTRRMSDESPMEHTFTLRNDSAAPVTVDRLQSSCGCTTAFLAGEQSPPLTVGPGGIVPVRVSIAPHRLAPGPVYKSVWVFTHGASDASTLLEITGTLQDEDAPTPPTVPAAPAISAVPSIPAAPTVRAAPQLGHPAPVFTLADTHGAPFTLTAASGHSAALFFFCGCPWCADAARAWGKVQRGGRLSLSTQTLVVFAGSPAETEAFAAKNGLDRKRTTLLPDPDSKLTEGVYKLNSCPHVFALDPTGVIRYTNDHADDQPRLAPAKTLIGRTVAALGQTSSGNAAH